MTAKHIKKMLEMVGSGKDVVSIERFDDKIPFDTAAFDVVCISRLSELGADSLLIECYRVLNDMGALVFSTPKIPISGLKNLLYTHGFEIASLKSNSVLGDMVPLFGDTLIIKAVKIRGKVVRDRVVLDQRPAPLARKLNHVTKV